MAIPKVTFGTAHVSSGDHDEYGNLVFGEVTSDVTPQLSGTLPDGSPLFDSYDLVRTISDDGTTTYSYRSPTGTLTLKGGQMELLEFDSGTPSGYTNNFKTVHNYVDFPNIAGTNSDPTEPGTVNGIATRYEPDTPYANVETDSSWTSTGLQAFAGIGYPEDGTHREEVTKQGETGTYTTVETVNHTLGDPAVDNNGVDYVGNYIVVPPVSEGGENDYVLQLLNIGTKSPSPTSGTTVRGVTFSLNEVSYTTNITTIPEIWKPNQSFQNSNELASAIKGSVVFRIYPDSEYTIGTKMNETTVGVSSISIAPSSANGAIATHSEVTVSCSSSHKLTDNQNQVIISGSTSPEHINGLHNVHSVTSSSSFTFLIPKSTSQSGETVSNLGSIKLVTFDGIDKTGAVLRTSTGGGGSLVAEVLHGGCSGNNVVILRGTPSIQKGRRYYVYSDKDSTSHFATVSLVSGPRYKSLFHEGGFTLNETTGRVYTNGKFNGVSNGVKELDSYFPKFKHAREQALNTIVSTGTITQADATGESEGDTVTITGGPTLPTTAFYKTITYANGFTANVNSRQSDTSLTVQHNALITEPETFTLSYLDKVYPTPNTSTYWAYNRTNDLALTDPNKNGGYPALMGTHEMFNTPVHFTVRAMKRSDHLRSSGLSSSTISYSGFGTFENGTNNYVDGKLFIRVYTNTDSDRDDMTKVYVDQNNASRTSDDFNRNDNAFEVNDEPVSNQEFLANNYSNGNFTLVNSV